jgi:hypothetical protein
MDPQKPPDQKTNQQTVQDSTHVAQAQDSGIAIVIGTLEFTLPPALVRWWHASKWFVLGTPLVSILITLVVAWQWHSISWRVHLTLAQPMEGEINIALAAFPPGLEQVRPALEDELRTSLKNLRVLDSEVQLATFAAYVDSEQRAEELARTVDAQLVIWARADEQAKEVRTRFTLLVFDEDIEVAETLTDTPVPRQKATDHFQWRSEVIATFIRGVHFLVHDAHEQAFHDFAKAEEIVDAQLDQTNDDALQRIKAVLLLYMGRSKAALLAEDPAYLPWGCDAPDPSRETCLSPEEMYQTIIARYPEYSWAYIGLGNIAFTRSYIEEDPSLLAQAATHYQTALDLERHGLADLPPEANVAVKARLNLGNVALEQSLYEAIDTDEWKTHLERAFDQYALVAHAADALPRHRAHGYYGLASVHIERGACAAAEAEVQQCINLAQQDLQATGLVQHCTNLRHLARTCQQETADVP